MRKFILICLLCASALLNTNAFCACRALLIGIEDYPRMPRNPGFDVGLPGPKNDVKIMNRLLQDRYGINSQDIKILLDSQATHNGIEAAIVGWLNGSVQTGDTALIYYSGHGSNLPDVNGDENDGKDEAFVCNDMNPEDTKISQYVIDDELSKWINSMSNRGVKVVLIADCCHSGTISRDIVGGSIDKYLPVSESLMKNMKMKTQKKTVITKEASQNDDANSTLIAACLDDQTSQTATFPGGWHGVLTYNLVEYLESVYTNPSYDEIAEYLQRTIPTKFKQTPQLSGLYLSDRFLDASINSSTIVSTQIIVDNAISSVDNLKVFLSGFGPDRAIITKEFDTISYVKIVDDEAESDRILVKTSENEYQAHFNLRDGYVEYEIIAADLLDLLTELRPCLMRAYVWKQLSKIQNEDKSFKPEVMIDSSYNKNLSIRPTAYKPTGTIVKIGEKTIFQFKAAKTCFLTLIDLPTEGPLTVLFPNKYNSASMPIKENILYCIPSLDMDFDIYAKGPAGRDIVIAIASDKPLDLSILNLDIMNESTGIRQSIDDEAGSKLFKIREKKNLAVVPSGSFAIAYLIADVVD